MRRRVGRSRDEARRRAAREMSGTFHVKHGGFLDRAVILRALEQST